MFHANRDRFIVIWAIKWVYFCLRECGVCAAMPLLFTETLFHTNHLLHYFQEQQRYQCILGLAEQRDRATGCLKRHLLTSPSIFILQWECWNCNLAAFLLIVAWKSVLICSIKLTGKRETKKEAAIIPVIADL